MVRRYLQVKEFIDEMDRDLVDCLPSPQKQIVIQEMKEVMSQLESVTNALQGEVTMEDVRIFFDSVIEEFPSTAGYLAVDADIVHSVAFENALVKVIGKKEETLTLEDKETLIPFRRALSQAAGFCRRKTSASKKHGNSRKVNMKILDLFLQHPINVNDYSANAS
ncbi:hypothetical protein ROZALSC1DRAFT_25512 [Rozella allomycis CSF55]|uniref:Uncharacterized protein n=1 Tax=Rozella allomycis (strain CSF55) TaxID=988480 RepID=A0A4P9YBB0_ROZAC|nr:hypothetical protein ROZALSC1DRAFT_25512 [Rozella allomycis CSF55]